MKRGHGKKTVHYVLLWFCQGGWPARSVALWIEQMKLCMVRQGRDWWLCFGKILPLLLCRQSLSTLIFVWPLLQYHIWLACSYASCHDINRLNLWTVCKPQLNIFQSKRCCGRGVSSASNRILAKTDTVSTVLSTLPFIVINDSLDHEVGGTLRISSRSKKVFSRAKASSFLVFFISSMTLKSCEKCFVH